MSYGYKGIHMKQKHFFGLLIFLLMINLTFMSCEIEHKFNNSDLTRYEQAGESVAAKNWTVDYDCSNFSVQFYQNCYKSGLPCRIRFGLSGGGGFSEEPHAWNSVFIEGQWVDWEPQLNCIYYWHNQNQGYNSLTEMFLSPYKRYDIYRLMHELIGRNVPSHIIDTYEIDKHLTKDSPFNYYFNGLCIGEETSVFSDYLKYFQHYLSSSGQGDVFKFFYSDTLFWVYNLNGKYYVLEHLEANDPMGGRRITRNSLKGDFPISVELSQVDNSLLQESTLTLIDIPNEYNGKYIDAQVRGFREEPLIIDGYNDTDKVELFFVQIKDGRADLPLWERTNEQKRYKGNDTIVALSAFYSRYSRLSIEFSIHETYAGNSFSETIYFGTVSFFNGGAVLSWGDRIM